ncbi:MAG: hypothetical protein SVY53_07880 [Chloroflexota bacterium]|nr:hypothetical protein [Chloroflexota bacterium]
MRSTMRIGVIRIAILIAVLGFLVPFSPRVSAVLMDSPDGWGWHYPQPHGNYINAIWGSAMDDIFAVGSHGTILHYDGNSWTPMDSGTPLDLNDVWGTSGTDVFAVGNDETILHFNGWSWSKMETMELIHQYDTFITTTPAFSFSGVWGSSHQDVFVVGGMTRYGSSMSSIWHYNGTSWEEQDYVSGSMLYDVCGTSSDNVFAVGRGTSGRSIMHYDGDSWSSMSSDFTGTLKAGWGSSSSNVFAVGYGAPSFTMMAATGLRWPVAPMNGLRMSGALLAQMSLLWVMIGD